MTLQLRNCEICIRRGTKLQNGVHDTKIWENVSNNRDNLKTRSHLSNPDLAATARDPENIMRNWGNSLFPTAFGQAEFSSEAVQEPDEPLEDNL